ncbi:hypothetical protein LTS07_005402 [Exophiala sideris]|uniref:PBP domain-containing protein n=1 Tax=Exophiala sideris TaxID=1016849 RepID=A0ABR0JB56_9EURO|nr:hypothetical protein LTS07_005402 [Exophiala sideris]KAK5038672.1 hypothetical protein LTR13_004419 [Exophiala sideris]KAK5060553.1 hypothetical protein LTR69_005870 [Exophiala sideris]KAK5183465.1 hypothetical protein LTR44_004466 [Eurotiomycetes sp. CCFEE 6388]
MFLINVLQGATGLVEALSDDYLTTVPKKASIAWICNHSRNTQLALLQGFIDIALTYERDQEALTAAEGWSITAGCAFHDHFCVAGPASDPADLRSATSVEDAFLRIARSSSLFHSRADASATMWKERSIWARCDLSPWEDKTAAEWYKTSLKSPSEALTSADAAGAYLLTDRSTLLRQTALRTIHNTTVFFEPTRPDDILMNSCYALVPSSLPEERAAEVSRFLAYLFSERGQDIIATFGVEELGGFGADFHEMDVGRR